MIITMKRTKEKNRNKNKAKTDLIKERAHMRNTSMVQPVQGSAPSLSSHYNATETIGV